MSMRLFGISLTALLLGLSATVEARPPDLPVNIHDIYAPANSMPPVPLFVSPSLYTSDEDDGEESEATPQARMPFIFDVLGRFAGQLTAAVFGGEADEDNEASVPQLPTVNIVSKIMIDGVECEKIGVDFESTNNDPNEQRRLLILRELEAADAAGSRLLVTQVEQLECLPTEVELFELFEAMKQQVAAAAAAASVSLPEIVDRRYSEPPVYPKHTAAVYNSAVVKKSCVPTVPTRRVVRLWDLSNEEMQARQLYQVGMRCLESQDFDLAANCFEECRRICPDCRYARFSAKHIQEIRTARATQQLRTQTEIEYIRETEADLIRITEAKSLYQIGERCRKSADTSMAENCYREAILMCPASKYAQLAKDRLAQLKVKSGDGFGEESAEPPVAPKKKGKTGTKKSVDAGAAPAGFVNANRINGFHSGLTPPGTFTLDRPLSAK